MGVLPEGLASPLRRLASDGPRALLQVQFLIHRNDKHVVLPVISDRDQRLEDLLVRQAKLRGHIAPVREFITRIFLMREGDLHPLQDPHGVRFRFFLSHMNQFPSARRNYPVPMQKSKFAG